MRFRDRYEAGRVLAGRLTRYRDDPNVIVLALPRGGVPVAYEVARQLHAPLDVYLVRKLGLPGHEELAMGALANGGIAVWNEPVVESLSIPDKVLAAVAQRERRTLEEQRTLYRDALPPPDVKGKVVLLVDDGLATGSTMRAAAAALRRQQPLRVVVAVPVGARDTCAELLRHVDDVVCPVVPAQFVAVGAWYEDFSPTSDEEVRRLLEEAAHWEAAAEAPQG